MCLERCNFSLEYNANEDTFVGYGFKQLPETLLDASGRLNPQNRKYCGLTLALNKWIEAKGTKVDSIKLYKTISANNGKSYFPGFHIFESNLDAFRYLNLYEIDKLLGFVMFKDVVSYGTNQVNDKYPHGNTFVTRYMKLLAYKKCTKYDAACFTKAHLLY